jgi:hypothetical protein
MVLEAITVTLMFRHIDLAGQNILKGRRSRAGIIATKTLLMMLKTDDINLSKHSPLRITRFVPKHAYMTPPTRLRNGRKERSVNSPSNMVVNWNGVLNFSRRHCYVYLFISEEIDRNFIVSFSYQLYQTLKLQDISIMNRSTQYSGSDSLSSRNPSITWASLHPTKLPHIQLMVTFNIRSKSFARFNLSDLGSDTSLRYELT